MDQTSRRLRARHAAFTMHAKNDVCKTSAPGRKAFDDSFLVAVDPEGTLSAEERARRAQAARSAHYTKLAYLSARKRGARCRRRAAAEAAEAAAS